jgi:hypothetical protein
LQRNAAGWRSDGVSSGRCCRRRNVYLFFLGCCFSVVLGCVFAYFSVTKRPVFELRSTPGPVDPAPDFLAVTYLFSCFRGV